MAQHDGRRDRAGQERDLGVPVLGVKARLPLEPVAARRAGVRDDLLLGGVQDDGAAGARERDPAFGDLPEDRLALAAEMGVVEPVRASDERAPDRRRDLAPGIVELDGEDDRRPVLAGEQARGPFSEGPRVERAADVGRVDGDAAHPRLSLERPSPVDELRDVGDRVTDAVPAARGSLEQHRLVEIHAARRVDGEERELAQVGAAVRLDPAPGRRLRGLLDRLREVGVDVELLADSGEVLGQRARRRLRQPDAAVWRQAETPWGQAPFGASPRRSCMRADTGAALRPLPSPWSRTGSRASWPGGARPPSRSASWRPTPEAR